MLRHIAACIAVLALAFCGHAFAEDHNGSSTFPPGGGSTVAPNVNTYPGTTNYPNGSVTRPTPLSGTQTLPNNQSGQAGTGVTTGTSVSGNSGVNNGSGGSTGSMNTGGGNSGNGPSNGAGSTGMNGPSPATGAGSGSGGASSSAGHGSAGGAGH